MNKKNASPAQAPQGSRRKKSPLSRRDVLKIGGATVAAAVVTHLAISGPFSADSVQGIGGSTHGDGDEQGGTQWHMAIDLSKCIGCNYCVLTCQAVNDVPHEDMRWNIVFRERTEIGIDFYMNRPCQHCQDAPCTRVCPVGATWVRSDGIVAMDYQRCIGCRYCQVACPYDVRRFNWHACSDENENVPTWGTPEVERRPRGVVEKCTFCVQRIDRAWELGLTPGVDEAVTPACVGACPVNARIFGNLLDPDSPVTRFMAQQETFRLREEWGTKPKVHYVRPAKGEA